MKTSLMQGVLLTLLGNSFCNALKDRAPNLVPEERAGEKRGDARSGFLLRGVLFLQFG